jgi:hypothetical protein
LLVLGERRRDGSTAFRPRALGSIRAKVGKNILYLGELTALWAWYRHVRMALAGSDPLAGAVTAAGGRMVETNIDERVKQMDRFRDLVKDCLVDTAGAEGAVGLAGEWHQFVSGWDAARRIITDFRALEGRVQERDAFCARLAPGQSYTTAVQALGADDRRLGTAWLTSIRSELMDRCRAALPLITA